MRVCSSAQLNTGANFSSRIALFFFFSSHSHIRMTHQPRSWKIWVTAASCSMFFCLFFVPVFCVFCRSSVSAIVSMPKASVNENRYVLVKKNKVGMPFNVIVPTPSGDMPFGKILDKFSFGTFVPGRLNTLHDLRPFWLWKYISDKSPFLIPKCLFEWSFAGSHHTDSCQSFYQQ